MMPAPMPTAEIAVESRPRGRGAAFLVAAGILFSRLFGLVRWRVFAHFFGNSWQSAAYRAATRIPNVLQNLFGEGVLSAAFIPAYVELIAKGDEDQADRLAGAVLGLLSLAVSVLVLLGVVFTPYFIDAIAPGFHGETRTLAIELVRILFPGTGMLVVSAWCLGILNSHRHFFLSYAAPVIWNLAIIVTLILFGRSPLSVLAERAAWGSVAGSVLQTAVQLPRVFKLLGRFRVSLSTKLASVRVVLKSFVPVVVARGVVQVSAYVDTACASLIETPLSPGRALSAMGYAQTLYLIPVSLFGMAVSAAELPEMSRALGTPEEVAAILRGRVDRALDRIAFYIVPSVAAFLVLGDVVGGALLQTGHFSPADTRYLWYILAGATVGLFAATQGRLYSSAFYALKDTKTPLYFATIRVVLTGVAAWWSAVLLPGELHVPKEIGAVGITATSGIAAWLEFYLLQRAMNRRIGKTGVKLGSFAKLWLAAGSAALIGLGAKVALAHHFGGIVSTEWGGRLLPMPRLSPILTAVVVLPAMGVTYLVLALAFGIGEVQVLARKIRSKLRRGQAV